VIVSTGHALVHDWIPVGKRLHGRSLLGHDRRQARGGRLRAGRL